MSEENIDYYSIVKKIIDTLTHETSNQKVYFTNGYNYKNL
jgi:hypothetical protein